MAEKLITRRITAEVDRGCIAYRNDYTGFFTRTPLRWGLESHTFCWWHIGPTVIFQTTEPISKIKTSFDRLVGKVSEKGKN